MRSRESSPLKLASRLFTKSVQQGRSKQKTDAYAVFTRPPIACVNRRLPRWYVETLSGARTPLADFFNSLLIDAANALKRNHLAQAGIEIKQNRTKYGRS